MGFLFKHALVQSKQCSDSKSALAAGLLLHHFGRVWRLAYLVPEKGL